MLSIALIGGLEFDHLRLERGSVGIELNSPSPAALLLDMNLLRLHNHHYTKHSTSCQPFLSEFSQTDNVYSSFST